MKLTLDTLVAVEDALEAIGQKQTIETFVNCHKPEYRLKAERAYTHAESMIRALGSRRKALNHIGNRIEAMR